MTYVAPESYVINVCVACGRQAVYPFTCGHRSETERWTAPIVVQPSRATRRAVQAAIEETCSLGAPTTNPRGTA